MESTQTPPQEHVEFDRLCSQLEDFEHIPTVVVSPALEPEADAEHDVPEVDQLILAGLVTPL